LNITGQQIIEYSLKKNGAYLDYPFGDDVACVKMKAPSQDKNRIFVQVFTLKDEPKATFCCSADTGEFYRSIYPNSVTRGWHCPPVQQPYFNTVSLDGTVSDEEITRMIDQAYDVVLSKFPKYIQQELKELPITVDKLSAEERAKLFPIILSEYNPEWIEWYAEEKANIERIVEAENIARISHFGSTSVPGLMAKPTVDILLEITENTDIERLITAFPSDEYVCIWEQTIPTSDVALFLKGYTSTGFAEKVFHIHVRYLNDWDELCFRNYLIVYSETAAEYAILKCRLAKEFEYDRDGYTEAKSEFIKRITEKARGK